MNPYQVAAGFSTVLDVRAPGVAFNLDDNMSDDMAPVPVAPKEGVKWQEWLSTSIPSTSYAASPASSVRSPQQLLSAQKLRMENLLALAEAAGDITTAFPITKAIKKELVEEAEKAIFEDNEVNLELKKFNQVNEEDGSLTGKSFHCFQTQALWHSKKNKIRKCNGSDEELNVSDNDDAKIKKPRARKEKKFHDDSEEDEPELIYSV